MTDQQAPEYQQSVQQPVQQMPAPAPVPPKKPIFKKWWFWLIIVIVVIAAIGGAGAGKSGTVRSDSASSTEASLAASASGAASQASSADSQKAANDTANMAIGQTIDLKNGLSITVNSVETGLTNYDGSGITGINVTYTNNGKSGANFNVYDWKAEDPDGAQRSTAYYSDASDQLNSGKLSAGGSVTGNVYFDEPVAKVYYYSSMLSSDSDVAWVIN